MPTALDSGIISRAGPRSELKAQLQSAVAHQLSVPITTFAPDYAQRLRHLLDAANLEEITPQTDISSFCKLVSERLIQYTEVIGELTERALLSSISFPHPLYRSIKDFYFVRVAEAFQILWVLDRLETENEDEAIVEYFPFSVCGRFKMLVRKEADFIAVFGPTFCDDEIDEGAQREYRDEFNDSLGAFKRALKEAGNDSLKESLHGDEQISRTAFLRQKLLTDNFQFKCDAAVSVLKLEQKLREVPTIERCPPNFFSKLLSATMTTCDTRRPYTFSHKVFDRTDYRSTRYLKVTKESDGFSLTVVSDSDNSRSDKILYQGYIETSFSNWNNFISESEALLRTWLRKNSGALGPHFSDEKKSADFGLRLARFLTFLFNAGECTIYQLRYVGSEAHLLPYSGCSRYPEPAQRLTAMAEHIRDNVSSPAGDNSIVIRAFRQNEIQYCQWHDQETSTVYPVHQRISYPQSMSEHDWGKSLCAVPIRVSGIFWGVIELVAMRPHSFPDVVRSKVLEVVALVAPYLFERQIFLTLNEINETVVSNKTAQEKKILLEPLIRELFGAKTVAIIRMDSARHQDLKSFLQIGRNDIDDAVSSHEPNDYEYLRPYINFVEIEKPIWYCTVGDKRFRKRFHGLTEKKFFKQNYGDFLCLARIEWSGHDSQTHAGVAVLSYTHSMDSQENWPSVVEFACQYIATVTASLYGSEQWETTVRQKLAHELTKSVSALKATTQRLDKAVLNLPKKASGVDKPLLENLVKDLKRHERSLETNTTILKLNRVTRDFENDPRLYYVDNVIKDWRQNSGKLTSFREVYNSLFIGASVDFKARGISVPPLDRGFDPRIGVDDWCLSEVLLTIKSNILKYGKHGSEILIRENSAINFGLRISNIGLRLDREELRKIFFDEFRGQRAKDAHPEDGSGFGLWYADRIMKELGCDIRHAQSDLSEGNDKDDAFAWHHFTLSFPHNKVKV